MTISRQTYSSPMSFIGITRRSTAWLRRVGRVSKPRFTLAITAVVLFLVVMYAVVTVWYLTFFGVFGIFTIPWRFMRRASRKQEHLQREQLATMQAMLEEQRRP